MGKKRKPSQLLEPEQGASGSKTMKIETESQQKEPETTNGNSTEGSALQKSQLDIKKLNETQLTRIAKLSEKIESIKDSMKEAEEIKVPDSINIMKFAESRADEIASMMKEIKQKKKNKQTVQQLPHHMRRRAASHNASRVPRRLREKAAREIKKAKKTKRPSRKHRRRPSNLLEEYQRRSRKHVWLETHIWFAKRFRMEKLWGYQIPLQPNDKNKRLLYRSIKQYAVLQDLSYLCCIELEAQSDVLLNSLKRLTDTSTGLTFASKAYRSGKMEGSVVLYHADSFPFHAIGPVTFLWQPEMNSIRNERPNSQKLWIWCHPTLQSELVSTLVSLFNMSEEKDIVVPPKEPSKTEEMSTTEVNQELPPSKPSVSSKKRKANKSKSKENVSELCDQKFVDKFKRYTMFSGVDVKMCLLKDNFIRYRLIGPQAHTIVSDVLTPADVTAGEEGNKWWDQYYSAKHMQDCHESQRSVLEKMVHFDLPRRTVIGCTVKDPRLRIPPQKTRIMPKLEDEIHNQDSNICAFGTLPNGTEMSALWDRDIREKVTATKMPECELNKIRSRFIIPDENLQLGREESRIPVIAIQQEDHDGRGTGWDIIAPLGWGMAFWIAFVYRGGRAFGLRELKSFSQECDTLLMPYNYPDTEAGSQWEEEDRQKMVEKHFRYPPAKRPSFEKLGILNPFFMSWKALIEGWITLSYKDRPMHVFVKPEIEGIPQHFFVLRNKKYLQQLQKACELMQKSRLLSSSNMVLLKGIFDTFTGLLNNNEMQMGRALISIKLRSFTKGTIETYSSIYAIDEIDSTKMKRDFKYSGPVEPVHKKEVAPEDDTSTKESSDDKTKRPVVENIITNNSRKVIGFVECGSYSYFNGCGYGLGHCSLIGFLHNLKQCFNLKLTPAALVRSQDCFQYRPVHIDVNVHS